MAKGNRRRRRSAGSVTERPAAAAPAVATEPAAPAVDHLDRTDLLCAAGATVAAAALFATTFSTHVALGDAPESVAGVKSFGVLHAPGYPSYVAVAGVFAHVVALGGWAARVNLFSLVCAALAVGAVFLLARDFGASRFGSGLGAFTLATSVSFWFNADFAKHYSFSALLVTGAALAATRWQATGRGWWLIGAGVLLGTGAGASWELAAIMTAGIALLVAFGDRRVPVAPAVVSVAALAITAAATGAFMVWRASQHPAVDWGEVTNLHRLVGQVSQKDFRSPDTALPHHVAGELAIRTRSYLGVVVRDLGLGAILVAGFGAVVAWRRLDWGRRLWIAVVALANLVSVVLASEVSVAARGVVTATGGYLIDLLVVGAVLVALAADPLVEHGSNFALEATTPARDRARRRVAERDRFRTGMVVVLVAIVLVPSVIVHYTTANHREPPFADNYARRVVSELPHDAVFFVYEGDLAFPLNYRQIVFGDRPDLRFISATNLSLAWYRDQVQQQLGLRRPIEPGGVDQQVKGIISQLGGSRPAYLDAGMMDIYRNSFSYRLRGLVGQVVKSKAEAAAVDRDALARELLAADQADGVAGDAHVAFPNVWMAFFYARAHIELAKLYAGAHQIPEARTELSRSLDDYPFDDTTKLVYQFSGQPNEKESHVIDVIRSL